MNILIVDDDRTNILVLSSLLKQEGYKVLEASNGVEAIRCFDKNRIDMILMDILMPVMDGYQAAKEIKSKTDERFVPIIFLTALTDENSLAKCVESGGDDFLTKPYNRIILRSKIDALFRIKDLYNTLHEQKDELKALNEKIESDVALANHVYQSLVRTNTLPKDIFKTWIAPVSSFNGDIALVMQTQNGGYHVMLGDFTGHGMAAALGTIPVCDLFQDMTQRGYKILDIILKINQKLKQLLPTGYFCAATFISVNSNGTHVSIFNAGMPKAVLKTSGKLSFIHSSHLPLGIVDICSDDILFDVFTLSEESKICIYSDGLIECKNNQGELYGSSRLERIFMSSQNITDDIKEDVKNFTNLKDQEDDISLVEISLPFKEISQLPLTTKQQYNWSQSYIFDTAALKNVDPVMIVIEGILSNNIPHKHKDRIYTIITELFNNSLEHGILGLDSNCKATPEGFSEYYEQRKKRLSDLSNAEISIKVDNSNSVQGGGRLTIELHDSGRGFDYEVFLSGNKNSNIFSGRGIMLVKSICEKLTYKDNGRNVVAEYIWDYD